MPGPSFRFVLPQEDALRDWVTLRVGYPSVDVASGEVVRQIRLAVERGISLARPAWCCRLDPLTGSTPELFHTEGLKVRSVRWARVVRDMPSPRLLCTFAVTLGGPVDETVASEQASSVFSAYLLDAVGSVLVEYLADQFAEHVAAFLQEQGMEVTRRFSPGYCDWDIAAGQEELFRILRPGSIGLECTSTGLMLPRKSISACMVAAREVPSPFPCVFCPKADCEYRRGEQVSALS